MRQSIRSRSCANWTSLLPPNATLCADVGTCIFWAFQGIPVRQPGRFFATIDFSPMGCGIVGAIGVALARPDERVICIAGDGAFLMHVRRFPPRSRKASA